MKTKAPSKRRTSAKTQQGSRTWRAWKTSPTSAPPSPPIFDSCGITSPAELPGRDPYAMYDDLCRITGQRHDPCLLDTFIAAVRFMEGGPKKPWWKYTAERKRELAARATGNGERPAG